MGTTVERLRWVLDADDRSFNRTIDRAKNKLMSVRAIAAAGLGAAAAGGAAIGAATASADSLAKGARAAGVSVENFQRLAFVGDRIGMGREAMTVNLSRFAKRASLATQGSGAFYTTGMRMGGQDFMARFSGAGNQMQRLQLLLQRARGMNEADQTAFLEAAGFGFRGGALARVDLPAEMAAAGTVVTGGEASRAERFQDAAARASHLARTLSTRAVLNATIPGTPIPLVPAASAGLELLTDIAVNTSNREVK